MIYDQIYYSVYFINALFILLVENCFQKFEKSNKKPNPQRKSERNWKRKSLRWNWWWKRLWSLEPRRNIAIPMLLWTQTQHHIREGDSSGKSLRWMVRAWDFQPWRPSLILERESSKDRFAFFGWPFYNSQFCDVLEVDLAGCGWRLVVEIRD